MSWFKVSDDLHNHEKWEVLEARDDADRYARAVMLWTFAGSYCGQQRNGGYVTALRVTKLVPFDRDASRDAAEDLCDAGFWEHADDGAYTFKNWEEYQPAPEAEDTAKTGSAARSKKYRDKKRAKRDGKRDASQSPSPVTTVPSPTPPGQARPDLDTARDLRTDFSRRFEAQRGGLTWASGRFDGQTKDLAAWLRANPTADQGVMLDNFFGDAWAQSAGFPFGALAKDPAKYAMPPESEDPEAKRRKVLAQREASMEDIRAQMRGDK